jgi:hypothetical protein
MRNSFLSARFIILITQFQVNMATNCRALTLCMNDNIYMLHERMFCSSHERPSSVLFQYTALYLLCVYVCYCDAGM